ILTATILREPQTQPRPQKLIQALRLLQHVLRASNRIILDRSLRRIKLQISEHVNRDLGVALVANDLQAAKTMTVSKVLEIHPRRSKIRTNSSTVVGQANAELEHASVRHATKHRNGRGNSGSAHVEIGVHRERRRHQAIIELSPH